MLEREISSAGCRFYHGSIYLGKKREKRADDPGDETILMGIRVAAAEGRLPKDDFVKVCKLDVVLFWTAWVFLGFEP